MIPKKTIVPSPKNFFKKKSPAGAINLPSELPDVEQLDIETFKEKLKPSTPAKATPIKETIKNRIESKFSTKGEKLNERLNDCEFSEPLNYLTASSDGVNGIKNTVAYFVKVHTKFGTPVYIRLDKFDTENIFIEKDSFNPDMIIVTENVKIDDKVKYLLQQPVILNDKIIDCKNGNFCAVTFENDGKQKVTQFIIPNIAELAENVNKYQQQVDATQIKLKSSSDDKAIPDFNFTEKVPIVYPVLDLRKYDDKDLLKYKTQYQESLNITINSSNKFKEFKDKVNILNFIIESVPNNHKKFLQNAINYVTNLPTSSSSYSSKIYGINSNIEKFLNCMDGINKFLVDLSDLNQKLTELNNEIVNLDTINNNYYYGGKK